MTDKAYEQIVTNKPLNKKVYLSGSYDPEKDDSGGYVDMKKDKLEEALERAWKVYGKPSADAYIKGFDKWKEEKKKRLKALDRLEKDILDWHKKEMLEILVYKYDKEVCGWDHDDEGVERDSCETCCAVDDYVEQLRKKVEEYGR